MRGGHVAHIIVMMMMMMSAPEERTTEPAKPAKATTEPAAKSAAKPAAETEPAQPAAEEVVEVVPVPTRLGPAAPVHFPSVHPTGEAVFHECFDHVDEREDDKEDG